MTGKGEDDGYEGERGCSKDEVDFCLFHQPNRLMLKNLAASIRERAQRVCLGGFGVGLTWGGILMNLGPMRACEVVEYRPQDR